jgi:hypothetical protein
LAVAAMAQRQGMEQVGGRAKVHAGEQ